jgi:O-antigen ligase
VSASAPRRTSASAVGPNRIRSIADGVVEATCLVAVVTLPLYIFRLSPLGPETDKAVMLITLAVIAAGAWLLGEIDRVFQRAPRFAPNSLIWAGLAVLATYMVATALSIHPSVSLFGTIARHQGLLTHASYTVFFICVATRLRRREQVGRLIGVLVFSSVPAVLYGVVQQFGVDPAPTIGDISTIQWPVRSSFGQHIFFAAYLVLVIPLTAARLLDLWDRRAETPQPGAGDEPLLGIFLALFVGLSFLGFLAIGDRLPPIFAVFPALLAGYVLLAVVFDDLPDTASMRQVRMWVYGVLLALQILALIFTSARGPWLGFFATLPVFALLAAWRLNRPRISWGVLGAAGLLALFVLVLNIPGGPLQPLRTKHLFNRIANIEGYANESSGAGRLQIWRGVGTLMTTQPAVGNTWGGIGRAVVGYGPESMDAAFEAVFPLKLRVETAESYTWDRAHSIYLDTLIDAGILGLLALLAAVVFFFWRVLRFLAGRTGGGWLAIGLASAITGHLVEGIFGLETAASLLVFWVILGLGASQSMTADQTERNDTTSIQWHRIVPGYWIAFVPVAGVMMLWSSLPDHPGTAMTVWLLALLGGVAAVAWLVTPRAATTPAHNGKVAARGTPARIAPAPRITIVAAGALFLLVLLGLLSQWNYETAALAETAGFHNLTHGLIPQGIADLQRAASMEDGQAKYQEDLATVYGGIASSNPQSAEVGYVPRGDDARTLDPQRVLTLGRDQLYALAVLSLQSAQAVAPLDATVYSRLGDLYMNWGKPGPALRQYAQAEKLSVHNPNYLDGEARAMFAAGRRQAALRRALDAVTLDHTYWYSHSTLAGIYHALGQTARARAEATLGLFWEPITHPPATKSQLDELRTLQRTG